MSRLKNKNKINRIICSWPVLILLSVGILLVGKGVWGVYKSEKISRDNRQSSEERYGILGDKGDLITSEIKMLKTEKGIEAEIRDKFRVVKEGEQLAIIINSDDGEDQVEIKEEKIWVKIWNFFKFLRD